MRAKAHIPPIAILGPTASGKSSLGLALAESFAKDGIVCEIIACDSVQIYRGFDIGSAKPSRMERTAFPHHMIDIRDAGEDFDAASYKKLTKEIINQIQARGHIPLIIGGTGLYFRALSDQDSFHDLPHDKELREKLVQLNPDEILKNLTELNPRRAREIHPHDHFRLTRALELAILKKNRSLVAPSLNEEKLDIFTVIKMPARQKLHESIASRTLSMLKQGLLAEVERLLQEGVDPNCKPMQSIGYRQCIEYLQGQCPASMLADRIVFATRKYAKRQCTWFKKVPRRLLDESTDISPQFILNALKEIDHEQPAPRNSSNPHR